jgi:hypothetical protein
LLLLEIVMVLVRDHEIFGAHSHLKQSSHWKHEHRLLCGENKVLAVMCDEQRAQQNTLWQAVTANLIVYMITVLTSI